ncbi:hypothetical protein RHMOL_Rhmol07G0038200 [Rhododendron molle]|uniref:Uncharacterized protein n=1 Tax=Rhododendron molle TaxID=49168 RepID=A0ACC0MYR2_RHOML|nr:hypothetical protein RHMOL_Rhmol07G0038200 [Rhododendron molle]
MENSNWSLFNSNSSSCTSGTRGQNSHCSSLAWDIWDLGTSRYDWSATNTATTTNTHYPFHHAISAAATPTAATTATYPDESVAHALMLNHHQQGTTTVSVYGGAGGSHYQPDPHLMCLKLGKRHYFEDTASLQGERHVDEGICAAKRGRSPYYGYGGGIDVVGGPSTSAGAVTVASAAAVPRCQVEGCHVALVEAKEYHRRHKVCEMHAKAPKVVVLGLDQRFCQQCSRFHAVGEFDDAKRSCRRRLAGHNERRRKGSTHDPLNNPRNLSHQGVDRTNVTWIRVLMVGAGRALSLLSSKNSTWFSSPSAALRELIAEHRAAILARQLVHDPSTQPGSNSLLTSHHQVFHDSHNWDRFDEDGGHVTLDLMQAPSSAFGFLSMRENSRGEEEQECSELWRSLGGAHVV